jgi:type I restriction enzyme S subunit
MTEPLIAVPPPALVEAFDLIVRTLRLRLSLLVRQNANLRAARNMLLPRLVTGAIDVESLGVDDVFGWAELAVEAG